MAKNQTETEKQQDTRDFIHQMLVLQATPESGAVCTDQINISRSRRHSTANALLCGTEQKAHATDEDDIKSVYSTETVHQVIKVATKNSENAILGRVKETVIETVTETVTKSLAPIKAEFQEIKAGFQELKASEALKDAEIQKMKKAQLERLKSELNAKEAQMKAKEAQFKADMATNRRNQNLTWTSAISTLAAVAVGIKYFYKS